MGLRVHRYVLEAEELLATLPEDTPVFGVIPAALTGVVGAVMVAVSLPFFLLSFLFACSDTGKRAISFFGSHLIKGGQLMLLAPIRILWGIAGKSYYDKAPTHKEVERSYDIDHAFREALEDAPPPESTLSREETQEVARRVKQEKNKIVGRMAQGHEGFLLAFIQTYNRLPNVTKLTLDTLTVVLQQLEEVENKDIAAFVGSYRGEYTSCAQLLSYHYKIRFREIMSKGERILKHGMVDPSQSILDFTVLKDHFAPVF